MSGDALPWFITSLVVMNVVLVLMMTVGLIPRAVRTSEVRFTLRCPGTRRLALVRFFTDEAQRPLAVMSCTAFADTTGVLCDQRCLDDARAAMPTATERFADRAPAKNPSREGSRPSGSRADYPGGS